MPTRLSRFNVFFILVTALVIGACGPRTPETPTATAGPVGVPQTVEPPYPASTHTPQPVLDAPYPEMRPTQPKPYVEAPYPLSTPLVDNPDIVPFQLDRPVAAGSTEVTGSGPAGVPILIMDVTSMGIPIGQGTIESDGTFTIQVSELEAGVRIGIALGVLTGTQWDEQFFQDPGFNGEDAQNVPLVGFFFDTAQVQ